MHSGVECCIPAVIMHNWVILSKHAITIYINKLKISLIAYFFYGLILNQITTKDITYFLIITDTASLASSVDKTLWVNHMVPNEGSHF